MGIGIILSKKLKFLHQKSSGRPTDEEDGEGDEEQEHMRNEVEGVHEAAVVQHALLHAVGTDVLVVATKGKGHAFSSNHRRLQESKVLR